MNTGYVELASSVIRQAIEDFVETYRKRRELEAHKNDNEITPLSYFREAFNLDKEMRDIANFFKSKEGELWMSAMNTSYSFISDILNKKCAMIDEEFSTAVAI